MAGNGIYLSDSVKGFRRFSNIANIPIVLSLPAMGCIQRSNKNTVGLIGHTGELYANLALYHCDLLICLGARLDLRQTGTELKAFVKNKSIVRVDIDEKELTYGRVLGDLNFKLGLSDFFKHVEVATPKEENQRNWRQQAMVFYQLNF